MLVFDLTFFLIAIPSILFAGISKAGFGSGASFAAGTVLVLFYPPQMVLGLLLPLFMLIDATTLRPYWGKWDLREVGLIAVAAIPGVALGAWLITIAPADVFRFLIGAVSLAFVAWELAKSRGWVKTAGQKLGPSVGLFTGLVAGFTSFVSHAGGPPVAVYLLSQRLDKLTYQASTVLIFWCINVLKFVPYAALGVFNEQTWEGFVYLAPLAVIGAIIGVKAHHMVPEKLFFQITYVALTLTGTKLIWDALT